MSRAVMEQALDALKWNKSYLANGYPTILSNNAIAALEVALAQPVQPASQNPKFTMGEWADHARKHQWRFNAAPVDGVSTSAQPVQPALQPLTDEQISKCVEMVWGSFSEFDEVRLFTRAIEAAHNIAPPASTKEAP